jgi:P27 family predicted phage terminase small subunit
LPRAPKDLSKEARKKFKQLVKQLAHRRAVTQGDGDLIELYCCTFERLKQAQANIRAEGLIVTYTRLDSNGNAHDAQRPNISLKIIESAERQCLAYLVKLGLTPSSREHVRPTAPVATGKDASVAERLDEEIAALEAQAAGADEPAVEEEEDLLSTIDEQAVDTHVTEAEQLLRDADEAINNE